MILSKNLTLFLLSILALACSADRDKLGRPVEGTGNALADFPHWWNYHSKNIKFYKHFTPFDTDARVIPLDSFMQKYSTGEYAVLKYTLGDTAIQYKLKKIDSNMNETIRNQLRATAYSDYRDFLRVGKPLSGFGYKSIDGRVFDTATTKGKFVVMKFWFIGCLPCIAEMPGLNAIVASNRARKDVLFVSVAMDPQGALEKFLQKRKFDYAVVADKKSYLNDTLNINSYPTHMLIDKSGRVAGVCNHVDDLKEILAAHSIAN
ncbi:TlpA disulfide reductase family protein [Dyadobacter sp. 676]|uniref:TlpA disulfide reductase family protein n=1 Tax=Dyadobacter sp. 676 TaxID=3088362 RepID=A0AAU8FHB7_9BACT